MKKIQWDPASYAISLVIGGFVTFIIGSMAGYLISSLIGESITGYLLAGIIALCFFPYIFMHIYSRYAKEG